MSHMIAALCLVSASGILAAPAPQPKPKETGPWFDGWEKPVDKKKDCGFDRKGGKLTITVPGRGHKLDLVRMDGRVILGANSAAPMLLREVEGDFTVRVRVAGAVSPAPRARGPQAYQAGIVLLDGNKCVQRLLRHIGSTGKPMFLGIERRGDVITVKTSLDIVNWPGDSEDAEDPFKIKIGASKKLKLGIAASSDGDGDFKAEFDRLEITNPGASK